MNKKIFKLIIISISVLISIILVIYIVFYALIEINFIGEKEIDILFNESYIDEGIKVTFNNKDISYKVVKKDNINYQKIGNYYIEYIVKHLGIKKSVKRIINIIDNEKPKITLKGDNPLYLTVNTDFVDPGYEISDNYDKNLKINVLNSDKLDNTKKGEYVIIYNVTDSSGNNSSVERKVIVQDRIVVRDGITYIDGILLVNKKYSLPKNYGNGIDSEAMKYLKMLQNEAKKIGYDIKLISSYRSYDYQYKLYNKYVAKHGKEKADTFSAMPGHSEHQTGLAFDVGKIDDNFGNTEEGKWLAKNAHLYGFIIRYPKGKEQITGYKYEPWHIRYLGIDRATKVYNSGLCLEEYLKV